jgi:hypothetical protein
MLQQTLLIRVCLVAEVVTMFDSRTSCDNLWRVGHYSVAAANRW